MDRKEAEKIFNIEVESILSKLKTVDRSFGILPEDESYRIVKANGDLVNSFVIKFGTTLFLSKDEISRCDTPKHFMNLLDAKRHQLFLSLADLFSDLAEKIEVL